MTPATAIPSKHYYMGAQRVATQMAGTENLEPSEDPGEGMMKQQNQGDNPILQNLQAVLTDFGKQKGTDYQEEDLLRPVEYADYYPDTTQQSGSSNKTPSPGGQPYITPRIVYYYHPDYLGNVEYITDANGLPYQYFWYSPWGENLKEENATTNGWSSPYRFNGKEQDEETGLYYYGARYYNPQVSVWLSVDAMAGNAHNLPLTPYHFSANNPVMIIDPDGNDWYTAEDGSVVYDEAICSQANLDAAGITGKYLSANKYDKSVVDAIGAHIMASENPFKTFTSYIDNVKLGSNYFIEAAHSNYDSRASGVMKVAENMSDAVKDGIVVSMMTHDWVDNAGWNQKRNEAEHVVGMFLLADKYGETIASNIGWGNELRGLLINDRQSGNMINAMEGKSTNRGGPTAFEWNDLRYNSQGLRMWREFRGILTFEQKHPNAVMGP